MGDVVELDALMLRIGLDLPTRPPRLVASNNNSAPTDQRLVQLLDYWRSKARAGRLPTRRATFPVKLPEVMPYLYVLDVLPDTFRFRLRGTAIDRLFGAGRTGLVLERCCDAGTALSLKTSFAACVAARAPVTVVGEVYWSEHECRLAYESLRLPIADRSGAVAHLLCSLVLLDPQHG